MRVHLRAKAEFYFPVSLGLVKQLMLLSKMHYDGECQRASARSGQTLWPGSSSVHSRNGILTIWHDRFESKVLSDEAEVRATWDDLDLISKICEFPPDQRASGIDSSLAIEFRSQMKKMLDFACPKITAEWKEEFDV